MTFKESNVIRRFLRDEDGQDVIEWGLLAAFLSIGLIGAISLTDIDTTVNTWYSNVANYITNL